LEPKEDAFIKRINISHEDTIAEIDNPVGQNNKYSTPKNLSLYQTVRAANSAIQVHPG